MKPEASDSLSETPSLQHEDLSTCNIEAALRTGTGLTSAFDDNLLASLMSFQDGNPSSGAFCDGRYHFPLNSGLSEPIFPSIEPHTPTRNGHCTVPVSEAMSILMPPSSYFADQTNQLYTDPPAEYSEENMIKWCNATQIARGIPNTYSPEQAAAFLTNGTHYPSPPSSEPRKHSHPNFSGHSSFALKTVPQDRQFPNIGSYGVMDVSDHHDGVGMTVPKTFLEGDVRKSSDPRFYEIESNAHTHGLNTPFGMDSEMNRQIHANQLFAKQRNARYQPKVLHSSGQIHHKEPSTTSRMSRIGPSQLESIPNELDVPKKHLALSLRGKKADPIREHGDHELKANENRLEAIRGLSNIDVDRVDLMVDAMRDLDSVEDNAGMLKTWAGIRSGKEDKMWTRCRELLELLHEAQNRNGSPLGDKKSSNVYDDFDERFNETINTLKTQKTVCKHLLEDSYAMTVANDPRFALKRVQNNRRVNGQKKEAIDKGRESLGQHGQGKGRSLLSLRNTQGKNLGDSDEENGTDELLDEDDSSFGTKSPRPRPSKDTKSTKRTRCKTEELSPADGSPVSKRTRHQRQPVPQRKPTNHVVGTRKSPYTNKSVQPNPEKDMSASPSAQNNHGLTTPLPEENDGTVVYNEGDPFGSSTYVLQRNPNFDPDINIQYSGNNEAHGFDAFGRNGVFFDMPNNSRKGPVH